MRPVHPKAMRLRDREHDITVSTVRVVNIDIVKNQSDLLHLIANTIRNYSKDSHTLVQWQATSSAATYQVRFKKLAIVLGQRIARAFKHYHPTVTVTSAKNGESCAVTVTFHA